MARAFPSSFHSSEALRACSCQIFAFSLPGRASQAAAARHAIFRRSNRKGGQNHVSWRGAPPAEAHINRRSADPRPSTAAGDPPSALPCCLPETRANLSEMPNEGRYCIELQPERSRLWPCRSRGARFLVCQHRPGLAARLLAKTTSLLLASCQFRASISVN